MARSDVTPLALISRMMGATLRAKRSAAARLPSLPSLVAAASLGLPSFTPLALAAASAALVRSLISSRSCPQSFCSLRFSASGGRQFRGWGQHRVKRLHRQIHSFRESEDSLLWSAKCGD